MLKQHLEEHDHEFSSAYDVLLQMAKITALNAEEKQKLDRLEEEKQRLNKVMENQKQAEKKRQESESNDIEEQIKLRRLALTFEDWKKKFPKYDLGFDRRCESYRLYVHYLAGLFLDRAEFLPYQDTSKMVERDWQIMWNKVSQRVHPDKGGNRELFQSFWLLRKCIRK
jgi:hypothetical protein